MTSSHNPEINVEQLMQNIREEVAAAARQNASLGVEIKNLNRLENKGVNLLTMNYIENLLNEAELYSQVSEKFPDKLNIFPFTLSKPLQKLVLKIYNFIFKKQRIVNFSLTQALRESLTLNRQLLSQMNVLQEQVNGLGNRLDATDEQVNGLGNRLDATDEQVNGLGNRLDATDEQVNGLGNRLDATDEQVNGLGNRLDATDEQIKATNEQVNCLGNRLDTMDEQVKILGERLKAIDERHIRNDSYIKSDLAQQKRLITLFLEEARQRLPEPFSKDDLLNFVDEDKHLLDAFYVAFEEQFRGSREDIYNRLNFYLPWIKQAQVGTKESPILDVGCGRGEWLELLRQSGYTARGIDINRVMIEQCNIRGLEGIESDAIAYLQSLSGNSLGAITGFHIIEHLPFEVLIKLLDEAVRVLHSGGLVIFETPNPENLLVGACNFYSDPTHRNPLFPPTLKFLVEQRGLVDVQLVRLSEFRIIDPLQFVEANQPMSSQINSLIEIAKSNFYAAPDFAVIGKKA